MTEEDQQLVARAILHGARFIRVGDLNNSKTSRLWAVANYGRSEQLAKWTIGRAAEYYLWKEGLRSNAEHNEYDKRTDTYKTGQDLDIEWAERLLADQGEQSNG